MVRTSQERSRDLLGNLSNLTVFKELRDSFFRKLLQKIADLIKLENKCYQFLYTKAAFGMYTLKPVRHGQNAYTFSVKVQIRFKVFV